MSEGLSLMAQQDPGIAERLRGGFAATYTKLGRVAAASMLVAGAALATFTIGEAIEPASASAYDADTGDYPSSAMPCAHGSYGVDGACSNYDWGPVKDSDPSWSESTTYSSRGYGYRNCTDYVAWRVEQEFGRSIPGLNNATLWDNNASAKGLSLRAAGQAPEVGDIAQFEGDDAHSASSPGHVAFVEAVNADGTVRVAEYNKLATGKFGHRDNMRADHYIDVNGPNPAGFVLRIGGPDAAPPAPGADAHVPYAGIADSKDFYTDEGWVYKKVGGAAFLLGRREGLDTGKWGTPTGPVPVGETHDHEVGFGAANAHPPRDYTTVYVDGNNQQWTFFHGRAYAVGPGELSDLGAVNSAVSVPAYGNRLMPFEGGSPGQLANGTVYRFAGRPRVGQLVQQPDGSWKSFYVTSQTNVDCLQLTQGRPVEIIPGGAQPYVEAGVAIIGADQPAICSFPSGWVLNGPGGIEKWRMEGNNSSASPYRRRYYADQLTMGLNTSGNPQYIQMPTIHGLNDAPEGPWMDVPNGVVFVNNGNGDEFVRLGNAWHKVPWPDMNTCLGIAPGQIIHIPSDAVGALPQSSQMSCIYSNRVLAYGGVNYYVDAVGRSYPIPNEIVKNCVVVRRGAGPVADVSTDPTLQYPRGDLAHCPYETELGLNFVHEGNDPAVYVLIVGSDGILYRHHAGSLCVPDATTTQLKKYHLFSIPYGEMVGIPDGPDWFATTQTCTGLPGDGLEVH